MRSGIYRIRNTTTGKAYIGQSRDIPQRIYTHRRTLRKGTHHNPHLQAAWNLYGEPAFVFEILEEIRPDPDLLLAGELRHYSAVPPEARYNVEEPGTAYTPGDTSAHANAAREAWTEERRAAHGERMAQWWADHPDARAKQAARASRNRAGKPSTMTDRQHTPEARARMAELARKRWADPDQRAALIESMQAAAAKRSDLQ